MIKKILNNKIFNFIISVLEFMLFSGLILYVAFIIVQRLSVKSNVGGYSLYAVATGSMVPIYKTDDIIIVKDVEPKILKVGDDIVYKGNRGGFEGKIVVHRIIKIEKNADNTYRIFTKGVNNEDADPSIDETQVVGKVLGKMQIVSIINKVIRNQFGFFFLIFCPFVLVIAVEIIETTIEKKYLKEDDDVQITENASKKQSKKDDVEVLNEEATNNDEEELEELENIDNTEDKKDTTEELEEVENIEDKKDTEEIEEL